MNAAPPPQEKRSFLALLLRPFAVVQGDEVVTAAIMTLTVFLLLTAYYILKTAREPLILLEGGAEVKSYAAAGQSILLVPIIAGYSALAKRVGRMKLLASVYLFFLSNLLLFALAAKLEMRLLGVVFYLWVGIFNVTVIAQFWSFANDIYSPEQGKRLFAILGIGSSVGAVAGAKVAHMLVAWGPPTLMLAASFLLLVCVGLLFYVNGREDASPAHAKAQHEEPLKSDQMFRKLAKDKYLLLIAALTLVLNWVNNNGEYLVDRTLLEAAHAHGGDHAAVTLFIGEFKSDYFFYYNTGGVLLQLFAVSRIMKVCGVRGALYFLPVVSFAGYLAVAIYPGLRVVEMTKVAENSLDYSLQNTARQALFLVTDRVGKYVGKTVIDTLMMRLGDVLAALTVGLGAWLSMSTRTFAWVNLGLIVIWGTVLLFLGREHARRSNEVAGDHDPQAVPA